MVIYYLVECVKKTNMKETQTISSKQNPATVNLGFATSMGFQGMTVGFEMG